MLRGKVKEVLGGWKVDSMTLWKSEMWWLYDKTTSYIVMYEDPSIACKVQKSRQTLMKNKEVLLCYKSLGVKFFKNSLLNILKGFTQTTVPVCEGMFTVQKITYILRNEEGRITFQSVSIYVLVFWWKGFEVNLWWSYFNYKVGHMN